MFEAFVLGAYRSDTKCNSIERGCDTLPFVWIGLGLYSSIHLSLRRWLSQGESHAKQVGKRWGLHLFHQPRAVNFHRTLAYAEIVSHDLVGGPARNVLQDLPLAGRQRLEPGANRLLFGKLAVRSGVLLQGPPHALDKILVMEGLLDEVEGAVLHGFDGHRY